MAPKPFGVMLALFVLIGGAGSRADAAPEAKTAPVASVGVLSPGGDPDSVRIVNDLSTALTGPALHVLPILGSDPVRGAASLGRIKGADAAVLPSDILPYVRHGQRGAQPGDAPRYLAKLYEEEVHILASRRVGSVGDLAGLPVNFGPPGSRADITGTVLFDRLRIPVQATQMDEEAGVRALLRGDVAALVTVARKPARLFFDLHQGDGVHFLPVPMTAALERTYAPAQLDPADYPLLVRGGEAGRGRAVPTVAVPTVLAVPNEAAGTERFQALSLLAAALTRQAEVLRGIGSESPLGDVSITADVPGWVRFNPEEAPPKPMARAPAKAPSKAPPQATAAKPADQPQQAERPQQTEQPEPAGQPEPGHGTLENFLRSGQ